MKKYSTLIIIIQSVIIFGLLIFALLKKTEADKNLIIANLQTKLAMEAKMRADSAAVVAFRERQIADEARDAVEHAR